jgi:hypothetical protein
MPVYIDPLINYGWKLGPSCHLFADTVLELVNFAVGELGLQPRWIQKSLKGVHHFDLTAGKRKLAIKKGAIELGVNEAGEKMMEIIRK